MDKLMIAVGVNVCDFAFKVECCGAAFGVAKEKWSMSFPRKF
jgi:hypothetical protein